MKYVSAIVAAAGYGRRFGFKVSKLLVKINSRPLLVYSLQALQKHPLVNEIILVVNRYNAEKIAAITRRYNLPKVKKIVLGGKRRQDSVRRGLNAADKSASLILIHDAARPFLEARMISRLIKKAYLQDASIIGVPVKDTIKRLKVEGAGYRVEATVSRSNLWQIQTPQVFKKDLLLEAYRKFSNTDVTDDAMLVEKLGKRIAVVLGSYNNIKITTLEDLAIAKALLKKVKLLG
jgi:2-C-methyl-D-erythritol 4-phosphate cytidylyltransferase